MTRQASLKSEINLKSEWSSTESRSLREECHDAKVVLKVGSGCSPLESQCLIGKVGGKESLLYSRGRQQRRNRHTCVQRLVLQQSVVKSFYRQREGFTCRNRAVSSDSHLEIGRRWSDQLHLECFKYSSSSVPKLVCSHFFKVISWNFGNLCQGNGTPLQYSCLENAMDGGTW